MRSISVVIPVYNDKQSLQELLRHLGTAQHRELLEVLVVDGGSGDAVEKVIPTRVKLFQTHRPCRAVQMNAGARAATGEVLFFVHCDCLPPSTLVADINQAIDAGHPMGCYRLKLTPGNWLLDINSYFSRFITSFSGGGDQTFYLPRQLFYEVNGFNEDFCLMEDYELVHRLMPTHGYHIIAKDVIASSRKYKCNSYLKVNLANLRAFQLYRQQVPSYIIRERYYSWLKGTK